MASGEYDNLVGIDLGTTLSVIARLDRSGSAVTIPNRRGDPLTPSVVYLDGKTARVGETARIAASRDSSKAAVSVKREMGAPLYSRTVDGRRFRPETLSAIILRKLKQDAERRAGPIRKAVITVPAYFDDTRRKATQDAGRIAGLDVLDIINEPTAAALSYAAMQAQMRQGSGRLLEIPGGKMTAVVYDLGGGTFDVTVVLLESRRFETLATDGEVQLGGKDWDDRIVSLLAEQFRKQHGVDPTDDLQRRDAIASLAEESKKLLSDLETAPVELTYQGKTLSLDLARADFERMTSDLLTRTRMVTELVVKNQARLDWGRIDRVLLVGGSTRMPMVKRMLRELTAMEPDDSLDADQVVAQGAAIHAGILAAKADQGELMLPDDLKQELRQVEPIAVNAHSLGVVAVNHEGERINAVLIPKNTQLPAAASQVFQTRYAAATSIRVKVLEGEAPEAEYNIQIGECCITGLPPGLPQKSPVQVRLAYDPNGRVSVMALDMTHGRFAQTEIERQNRLTDEDVRREAAFVDSLDIQ